MARRMFSPQIVDSDAFLEMPPSTQSFYFHLGMRADDDGFVNNPRKVLRIIGGNEDDFKILLAKRFILAFENGVIVIKHWRINNLIRKDWYRETVYVEEKKSLEVKEDGSYTESVNEPLTNLTHRLGKDRLGKVSIEAASPLQLYNQFKSNPIWEKIVGKYPDRDYDYQFELMLDWWKTNKKKLPQHISAFENWLKNTHPDPGLQAERRLEVKRAADRKVQEELDRTPQANPETLAKMRQDISKLKGKFS